eukprot:3961783-Alexandrium_andersonii.AAC.1
MPGRTPSAPRPRADLKGALGTDPQRNQSPRRTRARSGRIPSSTSPRTDPRADSGGRERSTGADLQCRPRADT